MKGETIKLWMLASLLVCVVAFIFLGFFYGVGVVCSGRMTAWHAFNACAVISAVMGVTLGGIVTFIYIANE